MNASIGSKGNPMNVMSSAQARFAARPWRHRVEFVVAACTLLVVAACTSSSPDTATSTSSGTGAGASRASYADAHCPTPNIPGIPSLDFPSTVKCGYLTVPENRSKPNGRTIRIFVMRAPATSPNPKPDPVVFLSGGPGGAGSWEIVSGMNRGINSDRDVIYVDQRSTHLADPLLSCPEYDDAVLAETAMAFSSDAARDVQLAGLQKCRDRLAATGFDLGAYNTAENAADIADLRVAMGIPSWNLYGVSYGSKLALVVLRDHPEGIRSVVLDSVSPPNINITEIWWSAPASSFKGIFAACKAQPACAAAYPNLEADFYATVQRLDQNPVVVEATDAAGVKKTVNIDAFPFLYALIMVSEKTDARDVPKLINAMAHGDPSGIVALTLAYEIPPPLVGLSGYALAFDVFCSESANLTTEQATLARAKSYLPQVPDRVLNIQPKQGRLFQECPIWNVPNADPSMMTPAKSDLPVLVMEGNFDAATAPEWVDRVTPTLPNAQVVRFPFTGHSVLDKSTCALTVFKSYLDNPATLVDHTCADQITLPFTTG